MGVELRGVNHSSIICQNPFVISMLKSMRKIFSFRIYDLEMSGMCVLVHEIVLMIKHLKPLSSLFLSFLLALSTCWLIGTTSMIYWAATNWYKACPGLSNLDWWGKYICGEIMVSFKLTLPSFPFLPLHN